MVRDAARERRAAPHHEGFLFRSLSAPGELADAWRKAGLVDVEQMDLLVRMEFADFDDYWNTQRKVDARWRDPAGWWTSAIANTAHTGFFSSDRTIREYAEGIWHAPMLADGED